MKTCPKCGAQMAEDRLGGHCPACLMRKGLDPGHDDSALANGGTSAEAEASASGGTRIVSTAPSPSFNEQAGERLGRYKLLQLLGEGGMGRVWMAEQTEPVRRMVALKVIKPGMDSNEVLARFEAERQALALMDHLNIARILDAGAAPNGRLYFVMDLVKGVPLTQFCDEQRLSVPERLELFMQVCQGVQHAHQKGIIHRDLKPSNVMVALYDGKPVPKVIDFGVAKATGQRLTERSLFTQLGAMLGTLEYMSPEQAEMNQLDIDTRSDIYSLGVLLYELLTGSTPLTHEALRGAALDEVLKRIREEEPPKPSQRLSTSAERLPTISAQRKLEPGKLTKAMQGELDWIVMKALEKERSRRYETANAFATDLQHYLNDEPVSDWPSTARYRMKKFVRKHRKAVAVAASFVALLALATVVSTGLALWANREAAKALRAEAAAEAARGRAEQEARRANQEQVNALRSEAAMKTALTDMQIQKGEELFAANESPRAIAQLAGVLTIDRSNRVAAERLLSALTYRNLGLPLAEPLRHEGWVRSAKFSSDGLQVVTASDDKTARVWDAQTGQPLSEPLRHEAGVLSAQFSSDGLRVVTVCGDDIPMEGVDVGYAQVWNVRAGKALTEPLRHGEKINSAQFSRNGRRVVTSSWDGTARVWDAQTGKPFAEPFHHEGPVLFAQFSPDGLRVVTACWGRLDAKKPDSYARVWDAQTGAPLTEPLRHEGVIYSARFSPDGRWVVTASDDQTAQVWDAQTGKPVAEPLRHEGSVLSAQFSPDGLRVVTTSDRSARVWDARTSKPLTEPLRHGDQVHSAQFSLDGLRLVTASSDKTARVWDAQTGKPLAEPLRHEGIVESAEFSPDGLRVVTASWDRTARMWEAQPAKPLTQPLRHEGRVGSAEFSPDGLRVLTASMDKTARVWDAQTSKPITEPLRHEGSVLAAKFSPDGRRVVTASSDRTARVWDFQTGRPLTKSLRHEWPVQFAQFSPDGRWVVTASVDCTARVWDAKTGNPLTDPLHHEGSVFSAQFSPDGIQVVTASIDRTARVWDAQTGKPLTEPLRHDDVVLSAEFSPDGRWVVTASDDKTARVWDAQTGKPLTEPLRHDDTVKSARFSPDGLRVVTASDDKTARVWDAQTGKPLTKPLRHDDTVKSARFSPDGLRVVTASRDKTARVWDAQTGQPLSEPLWHEGTVNSAQFSPDGRRVVTGSADNTARVWEMSFGSDPVPPWLSELAESIGGRRLTGASVLEFVAADEFLKLKSQLRTAPATNYYTRWAKWFLADRNTRTISPLSTITVPEYVQHRIEENTLESLNEAVRLAPTSGLAFARLAKQVLGQNDKDNPRRVGEADFFSRYALKWSPDDAEVKKIRTEILFEISNSTKP